jgi:Glycosyl transferase family 2
MISQRPAAGPPSQVELTVLMPCLNEAETVATCVRKARQFLGVHGVSGEILVADNGSTDGSRRLAEEAGARVINVLDPGYGNALLGGIAAAQGRYIIMGDADDSYDFTALMPFLQRLRAGADLVMGNRFQGGIDPGAMPLLHRYLGNPALSAIGRLFFHSRIGDFHCGLRGFRRSSVLALGLQASGMEFASEIVVKATLAGHRVEEVPTSLARDGRSRRPHLRSWRDGWRHLRFLLLYSPRWLFLIPGSVLLALGLITDIAAVPARMMPQSPTFNLTTLVVASALIIIGFQALLFAVFTKAYASAEGFLQQRSWLMRVLAGASLEHGLMAGALLATVGVAGLSAAAARWHGAGPFSYEAGLRLVVPSLTALVLSCQVILGTFFLSILGIGRARQTTVVDIDDGHGLGWDAPPPPGAHARTDAVGNYELLTGGRGMGAQMDAWLLDQPRKQLPGAPDAAG